MHLICLIDVFGNTLLVLESHLHLSVVQSAATALKVSNNCIVTDVSVKHCH